jgi:hypothetical protein
MRLGLIRLYAMALCRSTPPTPCFILLTRTLVTYHTITEQHHAKVMGGLVFPNSVFNINLPSLFTIFSYNHHPPPSIPTFTGLPTSRATTLPLVKAAWPFT